MSRLKYLSYLFIGIILYSCSDNPAESIPPPPIPAFLDDGWQVSSLAAEGMNPELLTWLSSSIRSGQYRHIHSVLIVRNGKLIFEDYFEGYNLNRLHPLASVTKSVVSVLIGIAVDQGFIQSIDDPIANYFPEYSEIFVADPQKREITIRHLLTMSSGLQWDEWSYPYNSPMNSHYQMERSGNWLNFVINLPVIKTPGSSFTYNSGNTILLGGLLRNACEIHADLWAEHELFGPLGITSYQWSPHNNGLPQTGGGLELRPRDLAKIGYLFLNQGKWGDRLVVSQEWLSQSTESAINIWPDVNYGFLWWLRPLPDLPGLKPTQNGIIHGAGYAGQYLFIIPKLNMVVVCTSWNLDEYDTAPILILYNFILNAVREDSILAEGE